MIGSLLRWLTLDGVYFPRTWRLYLTVSYWWHRDVKGEPGPSLIVNRGVETMRQRLADAKGTDA